MTAADLRSGAWERHCKDMRARIDELRLQNDSPRLNAEATAALRGRIDELKRLLALSPSSAGMNAEPALGWPSQTGE